MPKEETVKFSLTVPKSVHENLRKAASAKHTTVAEIARLLISKGLTVTWAESSENMLRKVYREETEEVFDHYMGRILPMLAKSGVNADAALYMLTILVQNDYSDEAGTEDLLAAALKHGAVRMRLKEKSIKEYVKDARAFILATKDAGKKGDA